MTDLARCLAEAYEIALPHRGPIDTAGLFAWMSARAVAGAEEATDTSFARTLRLPHGPAWFELRQDDAGGIRMRARLAHLGDQSQRRSSVQRRREHRADRRRHRQHAARQPGGRHPLLGGYGRPAILQRLVGRLRLPVSPAPRSR